jgi:transcriptional regulator with XRE-family HTH domain
MGLFGDSSLAIIGAVLPSSGALLREARIAAGLSQRALARRARTAQSVIARIERGQTSPSWDTLARLLAAAGFRLRASLQPQPARHSHMLADVARILRLSPEERLDEVRNLNRFVAQARRV